MGVVKRLAPALLALLAMAPLAARAALSVATIKNEPFVNLDQDPRVSGNDAFSGFVPDLVKALSDEVRRDRGGADYDYDFVLSVDNTYGRKDSRNNWSGMVGMVADRRADFIAADLTMTSTRAEALQFTAPFMSNPLKILVRRSAAESSGGSSPATGRILDPFTWDAWLLLLASFLVSGAVLWMLARLSPWERDRRLGTPVETLPGSLWHLFASVFRGSEFSPNAVSTRILLGSWWVFFLIASAAYFINLAAMLGGGSGGNSVGGGTTVRDLLDNRDLKFAVFKGGSTHQMLRNSNDPIHKDIYARIDSEDFISSNKEGIERVTSEPNLAIIMEGSTADYAVSENCDLAAVGNLNERNYALAFNRGHRSFGAWNRAVLKLTESGEIDRLKNKWWKDNQCGGGGTGGGGGGGSGGRRAFCSWQMSCLFLSLAVMLLVSIVASLLELLLVKTPRQQREGRAKNFKMGIQDAMPMKKKKGGKKEEEDEEEEKGEKEALKEKEANNA